MESPSVLQFYERALELTRTMLEAAQKSDWDALVEWEKQRAAVIERLQQDDPDPTRDGAVRDRKRELILSMLRLDEQIQLLTQDWMHELREVLESLQAQQRPDRSFRS